MRLDQFEKQASSLIYTEPGKLAPAGYNDGSEQYLLDLFLKTSDLSVGSQELQRAIRDWPSLYHLSPYRTTIFDCFEFSDRTANVLELGCGCGAITRWLGEHFGRVDAIEGNVNRAKVARARCRDLNNVEVYSANYSQLQFERKYQIATLIGVLEYGHLYHPQHRKSPHLAGVSNLSQARSALVDDGVLVLAIENRLGLKYWTGAREDHSGKRFESIHGYPECNSAVTFNATELAQMLSEAGFGRIEFFLPWPDYKLAQTIINGEQARSEHYLHNWIRTPFPDRHSGKRQLIVNESLVLRELFRDGQFVKLANSFLVLAWADSNPANAQQLETDWICKYYALDRSAKLKKSVALRSTAINEFTVTQKLMSPGSNAKIGTGVVEFHLPCDPFLRGDLLLYRIYEAAFSSNPEAEFQCWLQQYVDFIIHTFGTPVSDERGRPMLKGEAIDAMPWNIVVDPVTSEWQIFDLEWIMNESVPLSDIVYRCLLHLHVRNAAYLSSIFTDNRDTSLAKWLQRVIPNYCDDDLIIAKRRENDLGRHVILADEIEAHSDNNLAKCNEILSGAKGLCDSGRFADANSILEQLVQSKREYHPAWHQLGIIAYMIGNLDRADDCISVARELAPDNVEYTNDLAVVYCKQQRYREAIALCERALKIDATFGPVLETLTAARSNLESP